MSKYHKILTESRRFVKKEAKRKHNEEKTYNKALYTQRMG